MNKDILHLILAAKWLTIRNKQSEITVESCRQAASALGWATSKKEVPQLPEEWQQLSAAAEKIKMSVELKKLAHQHRSKAEFLSALGVGGDIHQENPDQQSGKKPADADSAKSTQVQNWLQRVGKIKCALQQTVVGQEHAIEVVCDGLAKQFYRSGDHGAYSNDLGT